MIARIVALLGLWAGLVGAPGVAWGATIDLTMTSLTGAPASAGVGKSFTLTNKVQTTGAVTKSFTVTLYLSTDASIATSDTAIGSRTVSSLAANGSSTATTTVTVPVGLSPGVYYVGAIADSGNTIAEANESNNTILGTQVTVVGSDLTVTSLSGAPLSAAAGSSFSLTNVVAAGASGGNAGAFTVSLYLSTDATITSSDTLIGSRAVATLASGATSSAATTVTVPAGLAAGTYYIGAIADSANVVKESNESNNALTGPTMQVVVLKPDLSMTSLGAGPARVAPGGSFSLASTVANAAGGAAAGAFNVGFYLSTDNNITTADTVIGSRSVTSLAVGASSSGSKTVTVPSGLAPGTYYIGAIADSANAVSESDESNNSIQGSPIKIGPDLFMASMSNVPATVISDRILLFDRKISNASGGGTAGESVVTYYLSTDTTFDASDILLGPPASVPQLTSGASSTLWESFVVPSATPPGVYYLLAIVDAAGQVAESDESNNIFVGPAIQVQAPPDYFITRLYNLPSGVALGSSFTIGCMAMNAPGSGDVGYFPGIVFRLSRDQSPSADDRILNYGAVTYAPSGVETACDTVLLIPSSAITTGSYYIVATINDDYGFLEDNYANNSLAAGPLLVGPDIVANSISGPLQATAGTLIQLAADFTYTVGGWGQTVTFQYYLSTDSQITTADTLLAFETVTWPSDSWVGPRSSAPYATIPAGLPRGDYYLGMIVDATNAVQESNETNNVAIGGPIHIGFNGCVGVPAGIPCKTVEDGAPCRDACDGAGNCVVGALAARGTGCPFATTCGQVCDGMSPQCQPIE